MDEPILTIEEREAINAGRWFSSLSPSLRHDILRCAYVRRYKDGELIAARGDPPQDWIACARGALRVSSTSISGRQITLTYVEPGIWFGDVSIFDGDQRTHDAYAHGTTTILCVSKADFKKILAAHVELYEAMLRLHARRIRQLYGLVEDLNTQALFGTTRAFLDYFNLKSLDQLPPLSEIRDMEDPQMRFEPEPLPARIVRDLPVDPDDVDAADARSADADHEAFGDAADAAGRTIATEAASDPGAPSTTTTTTAEEAANPAAEVAPDAASQDTEEYRA